MAKAPRYIQCQACKGSGTMTYVNPRLDPMERDLKTKRCPHCKGTGQIEVAK